MSQTGWWPENLKRSVVFYLMVFILGLWLVNREDLKVKRLVYYYGLYQQITKTSYPAAIRYYEIASQFRVGDPSNDFYLGQLHLQERQYASAVRSFQRALAVAPRDERLRFWLIRALLANKELKKAGEHAIVLLDKGSDARVLTETGSIFASIRWLEISSMFYQKAAYLAPEDGFIYREWGKMYANMGQFDRAITLWQKALAKNPEDRDAVTLIEQAKQLKEERSRSSTVQE